MLYRVRFSTVGLIGIFFVLTPLTLAQQSASFRIEEHVLNQAGHPDRDGALSSASYRISLDSLGESVVQSGASSASFGMDASFAGAYSPPGEVAQLQFLDATTLAWTAERSAGSYNAYRGPLTATGNGQEACWQQDLPGQVVVDADPLSAGSGFFYLITAKNRLGEEGSKGRDSVGAERSGDSCP